MGMIRVGEETQWGGQEGRVLGFDVGRELFRVEFQGEVSDPRRREEGVRSEWWLPGESVQPILQRNQRANARRNPFFPDSRSICEAE